MVLASACGRGRPDVAGVYLFSASAPGVRFPGSIELLEASDRIWGRVTAVIGGANQHILVRSVETRGRHLTLMLAPPGRLLTLTLEDSLIRGTLELAGGRQAAVVGAKRSDLPISEELAGLSKLESFEPGIISTPDGEAFPAFGPNSSDSYFATHAPDWSQHTLVSSRLRGRGVVGAGGLAILGQHSDRKPFVTLDGGGLIFSSDRPLPGESDTSASRDYNLWVAERTVSGWRDPSPIPAPVSTDAEEYHAAVTADGALFFASRDRPDGLGRSDIYVARRHAAGYPEVRNLGRAINDELSQSDVYVSPDESLMILVITDHPEGYGGDDLFFSFNREGVWSPPKNLGQPVNSFEYEYGPTISPDGAYLYFTSHRRGSGDIYRVRLDSLDLDASE